LSDADFLNFTTKRCREDSLGSDLERKLQYLNPHRKSRSEGVGETIRGGGDAAGL
jgi:hypothetical protein